MTTEELAALAVGDRVEWRVRGQGAVAGRVIERAGGLIRVQWSDREVSTRDVSNEDFARHLRKVRE